MKTQNPDWWREYIIPVPRPIPPGHMVGMRDEIRDGKLYVVEFLETVKGYQSNPSPGGTDVKHNVTSLCIDFERDGKVILSWSREKGLTIVNSQLI